MNLIIQPIVMISFNYFTINIHTRCNTDFFYVILLDTSLVNQLAEHLPWFRKGQVEEVL